MPEPTSRDLHIDKLLSNVSIQYMNAPSAYVSDQVFPVLNVDKQSDQIAIYRTEDMFRDEAQVRAPLTESAGGGFGVATPSSYFCPEYGYHQDIAQDDIYNTDDPFNLEADATRIVTEKFRIKRESLFGNTYFKTGVWDLDVTGVTDTPGEDEFKCWDLSGSTPVDDVEGLKSQVHLRTGQEPNVLLVSKRVHKALKTHPTIKDLYKYTTPGAKITEKLLAEIFEVDKYLVASALIANNAEGAATDLGYLLNQYGALLVYAAPNPSKYQITGGYTIRWNRPQFGGTGGEKFPATIARLDMPTIKAVRIEGSFYETQKLICPGCGVFINNAIAAGRTLTS